MVKFGLSPHELSSAISEISPGRELRGYFSRQFHFHELFHCCEKSVLSFGRLRITNIRFLDCSALRKCVESKQTIVKSTIDVGSRFMNVYFHFISP